MDDRSQIDSAKVSFGRAPSGSTSDARDAKRRIRIAWVGELNGDTPPPAGTSIPVDRDNLRTLFQRLRPHLEIEVPNHLGGDLRFLEARLLFEDFRSFKPESVAQAIPALRGMLAVRSTLERLIGEPLKLDGLAERLVQDGADVEWAHGFQRMLQSTWQPSAPAAGAAEPGPDDARLSGILSQVAMPGESTAGTRAPTSDSFERMVRELAGATGRRRRIEKALAADVIAALDERVGAQLESVMHHPRFLALESAWRSLKLVVDRTDFRKGISLEVLSVAADEVVESLERDLFRGEYEAAGSPPLVAVMIDHEFDASARDLERLERLASMAQRLGVPFATTVGARFFGVSAAQAVDRLSPLWDHLKRPEFIPFLALRAREASRYLVLAFPRLLTRMPYRSDGEARRGPRWDEPVGESGQGLPWGSALAGIASRVAASHAETGWPTGMGGSAGWIEDLPMAERESDAVLVRAPLDASLSESMLGELADQGFAVLAAPRDSDRVLMFASPTLHRGAPSGGGGEAGDEREDSLAYRMLGAQVAGALRALAASSPVVAGADVVRAHFEDGLRAELDLGQDDESVAVVVEAAERGSRGLAVGVHLRLPAPIAGGPVELDLAIEIGG